MSATGNRLDLRVVWRTTTTAYSIPGVPGLLGPAICFGNCGGKDSWQFGNLRQAVARVLHRHSAQCSARTTKDTTITKYSTVR